MATKYTPTGSLSETTYHRGCAALSQMEGYWQALRDGRIMPDRSDISPRGIESALSIAFILERTGPGVVRFRLAGSELSELMGMDLRTMPITSLFSSDIRPSVSQAFDAVFETPARLSMTITSRGMLGRPALKGRLLMLPLQSDLGDISRAVGGMAVDGQMGDRPRRFDGLDDVRLDDLAHPATTSVMDLAAAPAPFIHSKKPPHQSERPYLKLIK